MLRFREKLPVRSGPSASFRIKFGLGLAPKLLLIDAAKRLSDLRVPPSNHPVGAKRRPEGSAQHPHPQTVADLLQMARR